MGAIPCAQLAPLRQQLDAVWPSYYGPNEAFWKHEYEKHGSCAEDVFPSELSYFNTTLRMHLSHNLEVNDDEATTKPPEPRREIAVRMQPERSGYSSRGLTPPQTFRHLTLLPSNNLSRVGGRGFETQVWPGLLRE